MIFSVAARAVGVPGFPVVVAAGSPSPASLPGGAASVEPGSAFPFGCRGAVDPVHSISLLIMTLPLVVPAEVGRHN